MRSSCPYHAQPPIAMWREAVAKVPASEVDPTEPSPLRIDRGTLVASAGSCFAQHIRNELVRRGYNYLITEPGPASLSEDEREDRQYGVFPARFGNIYTTVQLLQLFERAYGRFSPQEDHWLDNGAYFDPFRPHVEPDGFPTLEALREDRARHLAATRRMFEEVELFVFTLGLTEAWRSRRDGAVFPVCPGCSVGTFDPARHEFVNFGVRESSEALAVFIQALRAVNPGAHMILTVSPVPLLATMTAHHVIQATTYSKAVLRVAAEEARQRFAQVDYFPSFEIIMATGRTHEFFAGDRRSVTRAGVARVMDLFFQRLAGEQAAEPAAVTEAPAAPGPAERVVCDEEQALRALDDWLNRARNERPIAASPSLGDGKRRGARADGRPPCIIYSSCIGDGLSYFLNQSEDFKKKFALAPYISQAISDIPANTPISPEDYASCRVFIYHPAEGIAFTSDEQREAYHGVLANLPGEVRKIALPFPHLFALWPFHAADPRNAEFRRRSDGNPIDYAYGDSFVLDLLKEGVEPAEVVSRYLAVDVAEQVDLNQFVDWTAQYQQRMERDDGIKVLDFVLSTFRRHSLFSTINHANNRLILFIVNQLLRLLDCAPLAERATDGLGLLYGCCEMPIHPSIGRYFGLDYAGEDTRYLYEGKRVTFAQYLWNYTNWV